MRAARRMQALLQGNGWTDAHKTISSLLASLAMAGLVVACICACEPEAPSKVKSAGALPGEQPTESAQKGHQAVAPERAGKKRIDADTKTMFDAFSRWRSVVPTIEDQVLERLDGAVSIRFRLKNIGSTPVSFASYETYFVAGTYYRHPSGDPYTIEGDDRSIAIWFDPSAYYRKPLAVHKIAADEEQSFTVTVAVPGDMPNPVEVSVCLLGPFVELNGTLGNPRGHPRKLSWIDRTDAGSP